MADTTFTDGVTLTAAAWFNDVNTRTYIYLSGVAGTNTVTATGPSSMSAYAAGQMFILQPANTSTGAITLNISPSGAAAIGAKNLLVRGLTCTGGELVQDVPALVCYDGTQFNIVGILPRGLYLIEQKTLAGGASCDFTTNLSGVFAQYMVTFTGVVPATDNVEFHCRLSQAAAFVSSAGAYRYARRVLTDAAASGDAGSTGDTEVVLCLGAGSGTGESIDGRLWLTNPSSTVLYKKIGWEIEQYNATPALVTISGTGVLTASAAAVDGIQFLMSSGNISAGTFALYGLRRE